MEFIKNKLTSVNIFFLSLLPLALASGPAVIEILAASIIIIFFLSKNQIKFDKYEILIFFFYFLLILSSLNSEFKLHSLKSSLFLIRFIILYYVFKYYFQNYSVKILNITFLVLNFTFIFLLFDGFYQYFLGNSFFGTEMISPGRMVMHFRDESIMGGYLSKMLPIYIGIWAWNFKKNNFKSNALILILVLLVLLCIILSNERTATIFILSYLIIVILISNLNLKNKFFIFFSIILLLFTVVFYVPSVKERYLKITINEIMGKNDGMISDNEIVLRDGQNNFLNLKLNEKNIYLFSTAHEASIRTAINMFINNILLGVGPNNFRLLCSSNDYGVYPGRGCTTHPHHFLSQVLSETGFLGLTFYLIFLVIILTKLFKNLFVNNILKNSMFVFYILILLPFLPSGNIFNNWYLFSLVLPFFYLGNVK